MKASAMDKTYYVYIMATRKDGPIYIGLTNDLQRRVFEHKSGAFSGFTKKYNIHLLVYFETYGYVHDAIRREKQLKRWARVWKEELIEKENFAWRDLSEDFTA